MTQHEKIYTQKDFREEVVPEPGMLFIGDDKEFYRVMPWHPRTRKEPAVKFTDADIDIKEGKGIRRKDRKHFWAVRQLAPREIETLIKKK